ncbi:hemerythrin-like domain-containing protein [Hamadaea flava]|uniref:Hemerythrin domain-containing protein n=1 Tax=Hamadaea flava TaxID=1742688 RepID=A0ABV8LPB7_9ACTN|nr:hemerythrin domain-containing protein [Hamadaea flava]MCP2322519.1 hemerythrin-like domain-containing protein [Hamadaea flava]
MTVTDPEGWESEEWGGRSIARVLADEHTRLQTLLDDALAATGPAFAGGETAAGATSAGATPPRQVADAFIAAMSRHLSAEEQELYPAARTALDNGDRLVDDEIEADREILRVLADLHKADPDGEDFAALLARADLHLRRHVRTADEDIFPELRRRLDREQQVKLGNRIDIFEEAAPTRPHPNTPSTPPLNKVVDPAIGTVDKVRDALSGRKTRPQDL